MHDFRHTQHDATNNNMAVAAASLTFSASATAADDDDDDDDDDDACIITSSLRHVSVLTQRHKISVWQITLIFRFLVAINTRLSSHTQNDSLCLCI